jgi:hypothetical protein
LSFPVIPHRLLASLHRPLVAASLWAGPQGCSVVIDQIRIGSLTALGVSFYHVQSACQGCFQNSFYRIFLALIRHTPCNGYFLACSFLVISLLLICFFSEIASVFHSGLDYTASSFVVKGKWELIRHSAVFSLWINNDVLVLLFSFKPDTSTNPPKKV